METKVKEFFTWAVMEESKQYNIEYNKHIKNHEKLLKIKDRLEIDTKLFNDQYVDIVDKLGENLVSKGIAPDKNRYTSEIKDDLGNFIDNCEKMWYTIPKYFFEFEQDIIELSKIFKRIQDNKENQSKLEKQTYNFIELDEELLYDYMLYALNIIELDLFHQIFVYIGLVNPNLKYNEFISGKVLNSYIIYKFVQKMLLHKKNYEELA